MLFASLVAVLVAVFAVYGAAVAWEFVSSVTRRHSSAVGTLVAAFVVVALAMPGSGTFAQSASISLDMTPFFTSLNSYLPTFVGIFGLIGGIAAALGFARFIIGTVVRALSGGGGFG